MASRVDQAEFLSARVGADTLVPVSAADGAGGPRFALPGARGNSLPVLAYSFGRDVLAVLLFIDGHVVADGLLILAVHGNRQPGFGENLLQRLLGRRLGGDRCE